MKSEKEKMLAGEWFDPRDEELTADRDRATLLMHRLNAECPGHDAAYRAALRELCPNAAGFIRAPFYCDYGYNIHLGKNFYANHNCVILDCAKVTFGDHVMVGPNCGFYTACHPIDPQQRREGVEFARPITVGNDVWFGGSCTVLPGVTIGDGCVIGAGSVVTRDIPANTVAAGNPCRVLRSISEVDRMDLMR